ncbi:hypothetical protein [Stenotrophomonas maltophilia]|uniref:hypothetical protein n=1 Tax=Stenotrophomonas maltophilia TaxID=40324 RepID=UPI0012FD1D0E|nr:hypothetical protein [Stenotrophomonas maltophilia]
MTTDIKLNRCVATSHNDGFLEGLIVHNPLQPSEFWVLRYKMYEGLEMEIAIECGCPLLKGNSTRTALEDAIAVNPDAIEHFRRAKETFDAERASINAQRDKDFDEYCVQHNGDGVKFSELFSAFNRAHGHKYK